jgi:maltose O-acetyltransferase
MTIEKLKRGFFWLLYNLFARHLPRSLISYSFGSRRIRAYILKRLFRRFGENVNIEPKVIFYNMSESEIGDNSGIGIGSFVGHVKIGSDVMIGEHFMAVSQNHEFSDVTIPMRLQGLQKNKPITIEDDVWIGSRVTLLPGITVGRGVIVGAGSVVTKSVPPYSIVGGNPAREIGKRK